MKRLIAFGTTMVVLCAAAGDIHANPWYGYARDGQDVSYGFSSPVPYYESPPYYQSAPAETWNPNLNRFQYQRPTVYFYYRTPGFGFTWRGNDDFRAGPNDWNPNPRPYRYYLFY